MAQELFTDECGQTLPRNAVIELARGNMLGSSEPDTTQLEDDDSLLQWATDVGGCFDDDQVEAYGHAYVTGPGGTV